MSFVTLHKKIHDDHLCIGDYLSCLPYRDKPRDFVAEAHIADLEVGRAMIDGASPQSFGKYIECVH